jgi:predicted 3-demethylubiquinone-9 3-methyltransferase (glyoxalase superfamily)
VSWQAVPTRLYELLSSPDAARTATATTALRGMRKIAIADLEAAVAHP